VVETLDLDELLTRITQEVADHLVSRLEVSLWAIGNPG
jgi:hypothetical protein